MAELQACTRAYLYDIG